MKEEIKQRIVAKTGKIKRFSNRINQYRQNRLFQNNRHRFYQELNEEGQQQENEAPDQGEARRFWLDICSKEVEHNKDAEWLEDFRNVMSDTQQQEK